MLKVEDQVKKLAALTSVMVMAAAEAMAQEKGRPARRIVISIPDRKLAVLEADRVVRIFGTAVGAPHSPSPTGTFQIVNHIPDPTWYTKGKVVAPGPANPLGTRWMEIGRASCREKSVDLGGRRIIKKKKKKYMSVTI